LVHGTSLSVPAPLAENGRRTLAGVRLSRYEQAWLPAAPIWSLAVFSPCVYVVHRILVFDEERAGQRRVTGGA
jgi:hypothetical protein